MLIKTVYKKQIHAMVAQKPDFNALVKKIQTSFLNIPKNYVIFYIDDEGDKISVASDEDLNVIFTIANQKSIKLEIESVEPEECGAEELPEKVILETQKLISVQSKKQKLDEKSELKKEESTFEIITQNSNENQNKKQSQINKQEQPVIIAPTTIVDSKKNEQKLLEMACFLQNTYETTFQKAFKFVNQHPQQPLQRICMLFETKSK